MKSNHPENIKRGGVGFYVKESFPAKTRAHLVTLPKCKVCEINLNRRKYFFSILYRRPSQTADKFETVLKNFDVVLFRKPKIPIVIITGDFNCRSSQWWENDIENEEGKIFEPLIDLCLHQIIYEATHIMDDSKSCIDVIFADLPNFF